MKKTCLFLIAALLTPQCYGAASSPASLVEVPEPIFALHNPAKSAQVNDFGTGIYKEGFELMFWPTVEMTSSHTIGFMGNALYLNGLPILSPLSVYVEGGAAEDPWMGPENQPRAFKYLPALRYFVLQHIPKPVEGRDFISIDSLESVDPQTAASAEDVSVKKNKSKRKADKYTPRSIQHMSNLAEVLKHYHNIENSALIIDLKAALTRCNPNWKNDYPIRQIPVVLTHLRGNISCRPYEDMTREQLETHEKEERERENSSSCSIL